MVIVFALIIALGSIAALAGGIWFLVTAFRTSTGWGVACLLFPPSGLVFLAKHWNATRLAFAVNLVGTIVLAGGLMGLAAYKAKSAVTSFTEEYAQDVRIEPLDSPPADAWIPDETPPTPTVAAAIEAPVEILPQEGDGAPGQPPLEPIPVTDEDSLALPATAVPEPSPISAGGRPRRAWGRPVTREELPSHVGSLIEISSSDKQTYRAVLLAVGPDTLRVRQSIGTGHMTYIIEWDKVIEVRVKND